MKKFFLCTLFLILCFGICAMGCTVFPATDPPANKPELPLDDDNSTSTDDTDPLRSDNGDNTWNNSDSEVTSPASDVPPTTEKKRVAMTFDDGPHNGLHAGNR